MKHLFEQKKLNGICWRKLTAWLALILSMAVIFKILVSLNLFRLDHFVVGKFDTGNMIQTAWNTSKGRFMIMTDHFGHNAPRYAVAHADFILALFAPLFWFTEDIRFFILSQPLILVLGAIPVFLLAKKHLNSAWAGFFIALSYLLYPAVGWLGISYWHGITFSAVFFLYAFWFFERWAKSGKRSTLIAFWIFIVLVILGKENLSLFVALFGVYVWLFREKKSLGLSLLSLGLLWFVTYFFVISPSFADLRFQSRVAFLELTGKSLNPEEVYSDNFFLRRISYLGSSYGEVIRNAFLKPQLVFQRLKYLDHLKKFLFPLLFFPLVAPAVFLPLLFDLLINILSLPSAHRSLRYQHISMYVPVMFLALIYVLRGLRKKLLSRRPRVAPFLLTFITLVLSFTSFYFSLQYSSPVAAHLTKLLEAKISSFCPGFSLDTLVQAKESAAQIGRDLRRTPYPHKILEMIPPQASVSAPDYLGAYLATREVNARFPGSYRSVDFVVLDLTTPQLMSELEGFDGRFFAREIVDDLLADENYELLYDKPPLYLFRNRNPSAQ
ncbi:MAG: DUF2079 domain-containing protein [Patescibacteria group bacterium]